MMDVVAGSPRGPETPAADRPVHCRRRVVVTGLGAITPVGQTAPQTWDAFVQGRSGVAEATLCDASVFTTRLAAEVKGFNPDAHIPPKFFRSIPNG